MTLNLVQHEECMRASIYRLMKVMSEPRGLYIWSSMQGHYCVCMPVQFELSTAWSDGHEEWRYCVIVLYRTHHLSRPIILYIPQFLYVYTHGRYMLLQHWFNLAVIGNTIAMYVSKGTLKMQIWFTQHFLYDWYIYLQHVEDDWYACNLLRII